MADTVVSKTYRVLTNAATNAWDKISFWTKASDVYNNNNQSLQSTVGNIVGIVNNVSTTEANYVLDARAGKFLHEEAVNAQNTANTAYTVTGNINVYVGTDSKLHFVNRDGADSVIPFSSGIKSANYTNSIIRNMDQGNWTVGKTDGTNPSWVNNNNRNSIPWRVGFRGSPCNGWWNVCRVDGMRTLGFKYVDIDVLYTSDGDVKPYMEFGSKTNQNVGNRHICTFDITSNSSVWVQWRTWAWDSSSELYVYDINFRA